jgi:thioredoxin reductase (NADPH)
MAEDVRKVVVVGSGPAGCAAAIYTARARLSPLLFEGFSAGGIPGGQLMTTTRVENYPGFADAVEAADLMQAMRRQAVNCGTETVTEDVASVDLSARPFIVRGTQTAARCHALIVATGAVARRLDLPGEKQLWGRGVSACAVCDGGMPVFRNQTVAVVGGGDTACEEALYLTHFARKVLLLVRRGVLRASRAMQDRVLANPAIEIAWKTSPLEIMGDNAVTGVRVRDNETGAERVIEARGLFYAVGHEPNTAFLGGQVALDDSGYIRVEPGTPRTSVEGVFAAGDVQDRTYRQAVVAAGSGCMAALDAERWLVARGLA